MRKGYNGWRKHWDFMKGLVTRPGKGGVYGTAFLLLDSGQLDAAEDTIYRAIDLAQEKGQELNVCISHRLLGDIYRRNGEKAKVIHHLEMALRIAPPPAFHNEPF